MKAIIFISILHLFFNSMLGQNPGYRGMRSAVEYGVDAGPALTGKAGYSPLNITQFLCFERTAKSNLSVGLRASYARTIYNNELTIGNYGHPGSYYNIELFSITPYVKLFPKKYVAPWGNYFLAGVVAGYNVSKHDDYMFLRQSLSDHDTLFLNFGSARQINKTIDILAGIGRTRIVSNHIIFDYGVNCQLISLLTGFRKPDPGGVTQDNYINLTSLSRIKDVGRFNFFLKIGYLF